MGTLSSTGIIGDILTILYNLGDMASGAKKLIGLL
ncbi:porin [Corynebacterium sp. FDAARGOS 1242]|nr:MULTISPECIES: porin [unclassified Corynebacterium]MDK8763669.1 porin [Corynebacterium sp. MSK218]QRP98025.1 porin [Corynebacterium sp. FDAARGOS 1242]